MDVANGIAIWCSVIVEITVVSTRCPVSTSFLGIISKGEAQGLKEGLTCSNLHRAILRRYGASLHARAETGGPLVLM